MPKNHKSVNLFLLKNAIQKHNQHSRKQVRATLRVKLLKICQKNALDQNASK